MSQLTALINILRRIDTTDTVKLFLDGEEMKPLNKLLNGANRIADNSVIYVTASHRYDNRYHCDHYIIIAQDGHASDMLITTNAYDKGNISVSVGNFEHQSGPLHRSLQEKIKHRRDIVELLDMKDANSHRFVGCIANLLRDYITAVNAIEVSDDKKIRSMLFYRMACSDNGELDRGEFTFAVGSTRSVVLFEKGIASELEVPYGRNAHRVDISYMSISITSYMANVLYYTRYLCHVMDIARYLVEQSI